MENVLDLQDMELAPEDDTLLPASFSSNSC